MSDHSTTQQHPTFLSFFFYWECSSFVLGVVVADQALSQVLREYRAICDAEVGHLYLPRHVVFRFHDVCCPLYPQIGRSADVHPSPGNREGKRLSLLAYRLLSCNAAPHPNALVPLAQPECLATRGLCLGMCHCHSSDCAQVRQGVSCLCIDRHRASLSSMTGDMWRCLVLHTSAEPVTSCHRPESNRVSTFDGGFWMPANNTATSFARR